MSAEDITNSTYDRIAMSYADRCWNTTLGATLNQFASLIKPGGSIIDLGCGPWRDVAIFQQRRFNIHFKMRYTYSCGKASARNGGRAMPGRAFSRSFKRMNCLVPRR